MKRPVDPKDKVDYREIWKRLIDEHMTKTELMDRAEVPSNERTCLHNGDPISILYLLRFCQDTSLRIIRAAWNGKSCTEKPGLQSCVRGIV